MKGKLTLLLLLCSIFLLLSCSDQPVAQEFSESKTTGSIDFIVKDIGTAAVIDSAKITWVIDGEPKETYTDSLGYASISELEKGIYSFEVHKPGYTPITLTNINMTESIDSKMPILIDRDIAAYMHSNSVNLSGVIKIEDSKGNKVPQAGVIVDLIISSSTGINNIALVDTTDENGFYTFSNLPERAENYEISTRSYESEGVLYERRNLTPQPLNNLKAGEQVIQTPEIIKINSQGFTVDSYNTELGKTDTLSIVFSTPVDAGKVKRDNVTIRNEVNNIVAANWSLNTAGTIMKIYPAMGTWGAGGNYEFSLVLVNTQNIGLNEDHNFKVTDTAIPTTVTGFTDFAGASTRVDWDTTSIEVIWTAVDDAAGYYIYLKKTGDDNYIKVRDINDGSTVKTTVYGLDFTKAKEDSLLVVSYTSNGTSDFTTASVLALKDVVAPSIAQHPIRIIGDLDNSAYAEAFIAFIDTLIVPGDIDTAVAPLIALQSGLIGLSPSSKWLNNNRLEISYSVPASHTAATFTSDTLIVNGLTDISGNTMTIPAKFGLTFYDLTVHGFTTVSNAEDFLDYDDSNIALSWDDNPDVSGYKMYLKKSGEFDYTEKTYSSGLYDTLGTFTQLDFEYGISDTLKIVGVYNGFKGDLNKAPSLAFKDVIAPSTATQLTVTDNLNNAAYSVVDSLLVTTIQLPEDVDTTVVPVFALQSHSDKFGMSWKWDAPSADHIDIEITLWVLPNVDASAVTTDTILITGLTDYTGNTATVNVPVNVTDLTVTGFTLAAGEAALINHTGSAISTIVEWDQISGVSGYYIYFKGHGDVSWVKQESPSSSYSSYTVSPLYLTTGEVDSLKITAQIGSGAIESDLAVAPIITLEDAVAPTPTTSISTISIGTSVDNDPGASALTVATATYYFSSDFDDLASISATLQSGTSDLVATATPNSTYISLSITVPSNTDASAITSDTVIITGVTDYAGNVADPIKIPIEIISVIDDFETNPLSTDWTTTWTRNSYEHEGSYSLAAYGVSLNDSADAAITITVPIGRSEICFYHYDNTSYSTDKLSFFIDGIQEDSWTGNTTSSIWYPDCYPVTANTSYTFLWRFNKGSSSSSYYTYIDDITFE